MPKAGKNPGTPYADGFPKLTERGRLMAKFVAEGKPLQTAAGLAGYSTMTGSYLYTITKRPEFIEYVKKLQRQNERVSDMSRKRVMDGFLEAIEHAKTLSEPMTQVAGWREIARMCGYYAPETKNININVSSQRVLSTLETLSDADLLEMIEKDAETIEGEAREVLTLEDRSGSEQRQRVSGGESEAETGVGEQGTGETQPDPLREETLSFISGGLGT